MSLAQLQHTCIGRINQCYDLAEAKFGKEIIRPRIEFSNQMTSKAGFVEYLRTQRTSTRIRLSNPLLLLNEDAFINDTPGHEAAHVIDGQIYGNRGHGRTWQYIMRGVLGQNANRTHRMETPSTANAAKTHSLGLTVRTRQDRIEVKCRCMTHVITKNRLTRMMKGAKYFCKTCKSRIQLMR